MGEPLSFAGRVALVTGAGSGLGRTYALELARRGAKVVVNDYGGISHGKESGFAKDTGKAQKVVEEIKALGGEAVAHDGSVMDFAAVKAMVNLAESAWGRLDIAIANAGIFRTGPVEEMEELDYDLTFGTHVKGAFNVVQHAWPLMKKNGYGRIVLTSSGASFGGVGTYLYGGAKSAMIGMVKALKYDGQRCGIQVNVLMPGAATPMAEGLKMSESARAKWAVQNPPEHVTPATLFLCHESCRDNGEMICAEFGAYNRANLVKGRKPVKSPVRTEPQSLEWVRDHWDSIMHVDEKGESKADWVEMDNAERRADAVVFGRRPPRKAKL